jgi:ferredoxin
MKCNALKLIYFSPTRTTKKIVEAVARGTHIDKAEHIDLTSPETETQVFAEMQDELAVIGAPVYAGRLPAAAVRRLQRLKGNNTPEVIIVVYGNRAFEDALLELKDLVSTAGFRPIAAGAFIGEHSFSGGATLIAHGRPDKDDMIWAADFGKVVRAKIDALRSSDEIPVLQVPGKSPYKEKRPPSNSSPVTLEALCMKCETCATACPTASITLTDTVTTDSGSCILCSACVKNCPNGARVMENPGIKQMAQWLSTNCSQRKEPEIFG